MIANLSLHKTRLSQEHSFHSLISNILHLKATTKLSVELIWCQSSLSGRMKCSIRWGTPEEPGCAGYRKSYKASWASPCLSSTPVAFSSTLLVWCPTEDPSILWASKGFTALFPPWLTERASQRSVPSPQLDVRFGWRRMTSRQQRSWTGCTSSIWTSSASCLRSTKATMGWTWTRTWTLFEAEQRRTSIYKRNSAAHSDWLIKSDFSLKSSVNSRLITVINGLCNKQYRE